MTESTGTHVDIEGRIFRATLYYTSLMLAYSDSLIYVVTGVVITRINI